MKSSLFYDGHYKNVEEKIKIFLNKYPDFLSRETFYSTRATGDAIQNILEENFQNILGIPLKDYSNKFARRAMADIAFTDQNDLYYIVDVKTHRLGTSFNMPNLTSVERLSRFYEDDSNYYVLLIVVYNINKNVHIEVERVHFIPIEFLSWNCLTIGALGWGQIQIANANSIVIKQGYSRKKWMIELCNVLFDYYPNEINKIRNRMEYFKKIKEKWENKKDIWE
ncbi:MAG TPA: hypothetical protein PLT82_01075 [Candidatus Hydrogenedens sp.]|nr:hypothetical protein [Candidatus Hydrogenedens sp.]HOK09916.1 hypothetical protein [Candidatus Hydrogenedens sp.]HPP57704.1 hypothetical protein [Candidatus Hydrogenedens sp.]